MSLLFFYICSSLSVIRWQSSGKFISKPEMTAVYPSSLQLMCAVLLLPPPPLQLLLLLTTHVSLAQGRDMWRALVNALMDLWVP